MTLVDFLGFDVKGQVPGQVLLYRCGIVAEIAAVGFSVDHGVGVCDVGFVHGIELCVAVILAHSAAPLGYGREPLLLRLRVVLHMRQQGP